MCVWFFVGCFVSICFNLWWCWLKSEDSCLEQWDECHLSNGFPQLPSHSVSQSPSHFHALSLDTAHTSAVLPSPPVHLQLQAGSISFTAIQCSVEDTVHSQQCTVNSAQWTAHNSMHSQHLTVYNGQCTFNITQCIAHSAQWAVPSVQHTQPYDPCK